MDELTPIGKYKWQMSRNEFATSDYFDIREYAEENFASGVWSMIERGNRKETECQILIFTLGDYSWVNVRKTDLMSVS